MKLERLAFRAAVMAVTLLAMNVGAWAGVIIPVTVTGTIWSVAGNLQNAPTSDPAGASLGTFEASQIDFNTGANGSLGTFLDFNGSTTSKAGLTAEELGAQMSSCSGTTTTDGRCQSTVIHLSGTMSFTEGDIYTLYHDDGVNMFITGVGQVINAPGPVSETASSFTAGAGLTNVSFDIWYMATNQNPEVLRFEHTAVVPEPATVLGVGTALFLIGLQLRRRKRA
jgi:hypothetical protein